MGVEGGDGGAAVTEVVLDLAEVLATFQQIRRVGMSQRVDMRVLFDSAGAQGQTEGPLERGMGHRFGGGGGAQAVVSLAWEHQGGMAMRYPEFTQELERALGQRDVAVGVAFAAANVQEHPLPIDVADFQMEPFTKPQAAGIDRGQGDPMIERLDGGEDFAHFPRGQDHGQLELTLGADQDQFVGPLPAQGFFPEHFDGANRLGGRLAGDFLNRLEVDEVLAELFG